METKGVDVLEVVGAGHIGLGGSEGDISDGVGQRGGNTQGGDIGAGRDNEPLMSVVNTK